MFELFTNLFGKKTGEKQKPEKTEEKEFRPLYTFENLQKNMEPFIAQVDRLKNTGQQLIDISLKNSGLDDKAFLSRFYKFLNRFNQLNQKPETKAAERTIAYVFFRLKNELDDIFLHINATLLGKNIFQETETGNHDYYKLQKDTFVFNEQMLILVGHKEALLQAKVSNVRYLDKFLQEAQNFINDVRILKEKDYPKFAAVYAREHQEKQDELASLARLAKNAGYNLPIMLSPKEQADLIKLALADQERTGNVTAQLPEKNKQTPKISLEFLVENKRVLPEVIKKLTENKKEILFFGLVNEGILGQLTDKLSRMVKEIDTLQKQSSIDKHVLMSACLSLMTAQEQYNKILTQLEKKQREKQEKQEVRTVVSSAVKEKVEKKEVPLTKTEEVRSQEEKAEISDVHDVNPLLKLGAFQYKTVFLGSQIAALENLSGPLVAQSLIKQADLNNLIKDAKNVLDDARQLSFENPGYESRLKVLEITYKSLADQIEKLVLRSRGKVKLELLLQDDDYEPATQAPVSAIETAAIDEALQVFGQEVSDKLNAAKERKLKKGPEYLAKRQEFVDKMEDFISVSNAYYTNVLDLKTVKTDYAQVAEKVKKNKDLLRRLLNTALNELENHETKSSPLYDSEVMEKMDDYMELFSVKKAKMTEDLAQAQEKERVYFEKTKTRRTNANRRPEINA